MESSGTVMIIFTGGYTFFSWFSETQQKNLTEGFSDEVAEIIKEDLWPNPLKYFNNKGTDFDDEDESGGDEEGDEDDN
ncbi:hypothetical protein C4D60_Mb10t11550 [Musa balbisiana]|uniref:Uncharacterized protein n=1 Tax=Musa balbisiana TaxID=52838 RepID=A0A4S8IWD3_MUSBA|nr:hypothetical protein C4D60_Mb10t11550 [Musa balbisiana]